MILIAKITLLFIAIFSTIVTTIDLVQDGDIPVWAAALQAASITGFITLQWLI